MPLNERDFKKHISQGDFKSIYLISGEETYLTRLYSSLLTEKLVGKTPSEFTLHTFNFLNFDIQRFQAAVLMVPFMAPRTCVRVDNLKLASLTETDWNDLLKILDTVPDTSTVIFTFQSDDKDSLNSPRFKKLSSLIEKIGVCASLSKRTDISLEKDIVRWAADLGSSISSATASKLVEYTTNDINSLQNELRKLASFADGREITLDMIEAMTPKTLQAGVFALADSVIDGFPDKAFSQLELLLYRKEKPASILSVISSVYVDAYRVKIARINARTEKNVADDFSYKNRAFVLKRAGFRASKLSISALRACLSALVDADLSIKSSSADKNILIEKLVAQLLLISSNDRRSSP